MDNSSSGRWSDTTLLNWIDRSNKRLVGDVLFPDCRILQPTVPGVQLYQFPLMLRTDRIYCAGQLIIPSDIATLEGQQIGYYDQSAAGNTTAGPYGDAPVGTQTGALGLPQWTTQEPLSYPVTPNFESGTGSVGPGLSPWFTPAPDAEPWYQGSRPRYYWRGGWLGLVPPPANTGPVTTICIDGVRQPDTVTGSQQPMASPENFLDAIVWGACTWAFFSNDGDRADRQRQAAEENYTREKRRLIQWRWGYQGQQRDGAKPSVLRPRYAGYRKRRSGCY